MHRHLKKWPLLPKSHKSGRTIREAISFFKVEETTTKYVNRNNHKQQNTNFKKLKNFKTEHLYSEDNVPVAVKHKPVKNKKFEAGNNDGVVIDLTEKNDVLDNEFEKY